MSRVMGGPEVLNQSCILLRDAEIRTGPAPTWPLQDFFEPLLTLGLGTVQQEDLLLFGHDVICIHLPSGRSDCRQHFPAECWTPQLSQPPWGTPPHTHTQECGKSALCSSILQTGSLGFKGNGLTYQREKRGRKRGCKGKLEFDQEAFDSSFTRP